MHTLGSAAPVYQTFGSFQSLGGDWFICVPSMTCVIHITSHSMAYKRMGGCLDTEARWCKCAMKRAVAMAGHDTAQGESQIGANQNASQCVPYIPE